MKENRIALFFRGSGGGVGKVIPSLGASLRGKGYPVRLFASKYEAGTSRDVNVEDLGQKKLIFSLPKLIFRISQNRITLLFCAAHFPSLIGFLACKMAPRHCVPIPSIRTNLSRSTDGWGRVKYRLFRTGIRWVINHSPKTVAVSEGVRTDLVKNFGIKPERIRVIYPPVLTPQMKQKAKEPVEHEWFRDFQTRVILSVGRLSKQKDYPTLIRAFSLFHRSNPEFRLVILGDGPERSALEKLIMQEGVADFVWLAGHQTNPFKFYPQADLFALTSRWGGLDNVLVEAAYFGLPIVCTDFPYGPRELQQLGLLDQLAPEEDVKTLVTHFERAVQKPVAPERAWKAEKVFSLEAVASEHERLFRETLEP